MRQLLLIASLVGLFMYIGFASEAGTALAPAVGQGGGPSIAGLGQALEATGASLEQVEITGWVRVEQSSARDQVAVALGWTGAGTAPAGETRDLKLHRRDGAQYLALRWVLSGKAKTGWQSAGENVRRALAAAGQDPSVTVQLKGKVSHADLTVLAGLALDALEVGSRQPWTSHQAVSVAGRSAHLPPSPFGVNIQVALRSGDAGKDAAIWVAWPALLQEY